MLHEEVILLSNPNSLAMWIFSVLFLSNEEIGGRDHKNVDQVHLASRWGGKGSLSCGGEKFGSAATCSNVESGKCT